MTEAEVDPQVLLRTMPRDEVIRHYAPIFDDDHDLAGIWVAYKFDADDAARTRLVVTYTPLVRYVVSRMNVTLPASLERGDLVGFGVIGLIDALARFDMDRGLTFQTYAVTRIRGAILDELRKQDHVPRSVRRKTREISAAREAWMRAHGRAPEDRELAAQLNVDMDTLWRWQADVEGAHHLPLDRAPGERENSAPAAVEMLPSNEESEVEEQLTHEQEVDYLKDAIMRLKDQERIVLSLYYFEELKLHEIAKVLELTESRVSQIHSKAMLKLKAKLIQKINA